MAKTTVSIIRDDENDIQLVMIQPQDFSPDQAKAAIQTAYDAAVEANKEEWNFGDVATTLESLGFVRAEFEVWSE